MGQARQREPDAAKRVAEGILKAKAIREERLRQLELDDSKPENIARRKRLAPILALCGVLGTDRIRR